MHGGLEHSVPRVVAVVGHGETGGSERLAADVAAAMSTTGTRVALGSVSGASLAPGAALAAVDRHLVSLAIPAWHGGGAEACRALRGAIEAQGRDVQRIVLDLGASDSDVALAVGPAADDVVCLVEATPAGAEAAAAFATYLGCQGVDDDVLLVLCCRAAAEARETIRAIWSATSERGPRLVLAGVAPAVGAVEAVGDLADVVASLAGRLLVPRPAPLRGGMQFFVEGRVAQGRRGL